MSSLMKPLAVQDVLSVFTEIDPASLSLTAHILIEFLTSDGLLTLQVPKPMASELGAHLCRIALEPDNPTEPISTRSADPRR